MYIILSQDAKWSLRLKCDIAGNASEVAISSYTMAGLWHGSKHAETWQQWPLSPWEQNQNKWPLFASSLLFETEITKNALILGITVLVELRLCLLICLTERKTRLQQHHVKMCKYGIWKILFHSMHQIFHSILGPFYIPYRFIPSIPHSIP